MMLRFIPHALPSPGNAALYLIAALMLCMAGCAAVKHAPQVKIAMPTPETALAALREADRFTGTFQTLARIEVTRDRGTYPVKAAVLMKWPDALRIEHLPLLGPPDFFMALNGNRLQISLPGEEAYLTGEATPENLAPYLAVDLPREELLALLRGSCPPGTGITTLRGVEEGETMRLDLSDAQGKRLSMWIDPASLNLLQCTRFAGHGGEAYTIRFEEPRPLGGRAWPMRIRFTAAVPSAAAMTIRYTEPVLSREDSSTLFDLPVPPGITPRMLPSGHPRDYTR